MRVIVDVDDVLGDTFGALEAAFGPAADAAIEDLAVMFPGADLLSALGSSEFHARIPPIPGASAGVGWLIEQGHAVEYLSSRAPAMQSVSEEWLARWKFPALRLRCVGREAKIAALSMEDYDALIDDQIRYLTAAINAGRRSIAMTNPWNASWAGDRIDGWSQIKDVL